MFGVDDIILGGLMAGGSLLSGIGGSKSAKKQNKMAAAETAYANQWNQNIQSATNRDNQALQAAKNAADSALGRGLVDRADAMPDVDLAAFIKARDASGYNPVTFLNSGALSLFDNRSARQAFIAQGTALQSPGMTTYGQTLVGAAPVVSEPSMLSALGGAITAGTGALGSSYQNNLRVDAANQSSMLQYLASVQYARKNGNALSGLGTPAFETSTGLSGASIASVAARLKGKADALSPYGFKIEEPTINSGNVDPSVMNPQGGRGVLSGFTDGLYTSVSDWYWKLAGRNMGADAAIATDNWFSGPGFKTSGPLDENQRRSSSPSDRTGLYRAPLDFGGWMDSLEKWGNSSNWYGELFGSKPAY